MVEYRLGDRLWVVKLLAFFTLAIASLSGPHWCVILFFLYCGALILHYAVLVGIACVAKARMTGRDWQTRQRMRAMNRSERDAFERDLVRLVDQESVGGIVPATGVSFLVMGTYGFASGARMQREMATARQSVPMRRLTNAEKWRAQIERRQPRDVNAIIAHWRQHAD